MKGEFWALPKTAAVDKGLTPSAKLVFGVLWTRKNGSNISWPKQTTIAESLGISRKSVNEAVSLLESEGYLKIHRVGKRCTNRYELSSDKAEGDVTKSDVTKGDITCNKSLHHMSRKVTSNRKRTIKRTEKENNAGDSAPAVVIETALSPAGTKSLEQTSGVNLVFDVFYKTINKGIQFNNKTSRSAAEWLIKEYGLIEAIKLAEVACTVHGQAYAPMISTPLQLKSKLPALSAFIQRSGTAKKGSIKQV